MHCMSIAYDTLCTGRRPSTNETTKPGPSNHPQPRAAVRPPPLINETKPKDAATGGRQAASADKQATGGRQAASADKQATGGRQAASADTPFMFETLQQEIKARGPSMKVRQGGDHTCSFRVRPCSGKFLTRAPGIRLGGSAAVKSKCLDPAPCPR